MGRIKTKFVKRKTKEIMHQSEEKLSEDFSKNKSVASEMASFKSKKLRNIVAGYLTRLKKARNEI